MSARLLQARVGRNKPQCTAGLLLAMLQIPQHAAKSTASSPKKDLGSIRSGTYNKESSLGISPCRRQLLDMST